MERNQYNILVVLDNVLITTMIINNINHTYKSKCNEPCEEDIIMMDVLDVSFECVSGKTLIRLNNN